MLYLSTEVVDGINRMQASSCHFQGDLVHSERSHHFCNTLKIIMCIYHSTKRTKRVGRTVRWNHYPMCLSLRMERPKCCRDFIVSSTSKDTKIPKNPKIAGALEQTALCFLVWRQDGGRCFDQGHKQSSHSQSNFLASDPWPVAGSRALCA